ncbi:MAG: hypothetical protein ACYDCL_17620 [Myxococcales bacterium]
MPHYRPLLLTLLAVPLALACGNGTATTGCNPACASGQTCR